LKRAYFLIGGIVLAASLIGYFLVDNEIMTYRDYAFNNLYMPPDIQREYDILQTVELALP
jgi:hypothetical protein